MIIGTAGHIDHGKSALVRALTGVDTDRLKEEKARGISIDLGFAYMPTDDGSILGFVDVPGHEKFMRNMLAGATGIDFVLLVVAADDGIMPQTREHLAILDLLGISRGLVALTKIDLVPRERSEAVANDIRHVLRTTGLSAADVFPVSAATGEGIEALRAALLGAARSFGMRREAGRFRLAVDRCFSLTGVGTIVTGAVLSGAVAVGDNITISPVGLSARVRSIHAQNSPAQRGSTGQRCALNLAGKGVDRHAISRGAVVLDPFLHAPADRIDATLQLLASEAAPLAHWTPVRLYHAAAEVSARAALLEDKPIAPGSLGRIQLVLENPIAAAVGDRFVLRDTSGSRTIGGGRFLDLRAPHRRRRTPARRAQLDALAHEDPAMALAASLDCWPYFVNLSGFARDRALSAAEMNAILQAVPHVLTSVANDSVGLSPGSWKRLADSARAALDSFHRVHPELPGLSLVQLAAAVEPRLPSRIFTSVVRALVEAGTLASESGAIRAPGHRFGLDVRDQRLWQRILPWLSEADRFRPPRVSELAALFKEPEAEVRRVLKAMARRREVVELARDRFFRRATVDEMAAIAVDVARAQKDGQFTVAQFRDRLDNGRKVAIEVLEYLDGQGLTVRRGDLRHINPRRRDSLPRTV